MREAVEAWEDCADALRSYERVLDRMRKVEASRRPVLRRRQELVELEQERKDCEHDLEICLVALLEVMGMVNDTWSRAMTENEQLTGRVQALLIDV